MKNSLQHFTFLIIMIMVASINNLSAQQVKPGWQWVTGARGNAITSAMTSTSGNDIYVAGNFSGTTAFDTIILNDSHGSEYVAKYNAAGKVAWVKQYGKANQYLLIKSIKEGTDKSIYISGFFEGNYTLDNILLSSRGDRDAFIAKLDSNGRVIWAKSGGGMSKEDCIKESMALDSDNNVVITGYGSSSFVAFDNDTVFGSKIYIVKYSKDGVVKWARSAESLRYADVSDVVCDNNNNICITGEFADSLKFKSGYHISASDVGNAYLAKFNVDGDIVWAKTTNSYIPGVKRSSESTGRALGCDADKNVYVFGEADDTIRFDNIISNPDYLAKFYLAKYDVNGNVIWIKRFGGPGNTSSYNYRAQGLCIDAKGNINILGVFTNILQINGATKISGVGSQLFIAQYDAFGNLNWANYGGNRLDTEPSNVCRTNNGLYVTGYFERTNVDNTVTFGYQSIIGAYANNMFLAKLADVIGVSKLNSNDTNQPYVYPNPVHEQLTIGNLQPGTAMQVFDVMGKMVINAKATKEQETLNTTALIPGSYYLKLTSADGAVMSTKIIKE